MYAGFSHIRVSDIEFFKYKLLCWANQFPVFCYLDSNQWQDTYSRFDFMIGIDALEVSDADQISTPENHFKFGYISYNYPHWVEDERSPFIPFSRFYFFKPRYVIYGSGDTIYCNRNILEALELYDRIDQFTTKLKTGEGAFSTTALKPRTSKEKYLSQVANIQDRIREGDFYELNYCMEFHTDNFQMDPIEKFIWMNSKMKSPMSAFVKQNHLWLLSFSPERFICKRGNKLIAQPMKGTMRRNLEDQNKDRELKELLENSTKERAENTMITDLIRNDLTQHAIPGSIHVDEYCRAYTYNTVHQMISTVSAELNHPTHGIRALLDALPVGSMTGAPKKEVVKNIRHYENFHRGLYSGNIGYIDPKGDYDFNVVIRSLQYDDRGKKLALHTGSAITLLSDAENEYEECLLKARSIIDQL